MERDYSRTEYVFGSAALQKMQRASFLIIGADGVAQEIGKNLALTGVSELIFYDPTPTTFRDLASSPFLYLEDAHAGSPRDAIVASRIQQLNPNCTVKTANPHELSSMQSFLHSAKVVIQTVGLPECPLGRLGDSSHAAGVPYILCTANGLSARIFCDFLSRHTILDVDGEKCEEVTLNSCIIESFPPSSDENTKKNWRFFFATSKPHDLSDGYSIRIRDVKFVAIDACGAQQETISLDQLERLVNNQLWTVAITGHSRFEAVPCDQTVAARIDDFLSKLKERGFEVLHLRGGYVKRIKEPLDMPFSSYSDAVLNPQYSELMIDFAKLNRPEVLHAVYCAITEAAAMEHGCHSSILSSATIWNEDAARENLRELISFCNEAKDVRPILNLCLPVLTSKENENLLHTFLMTYNGQIAPMASFIGGWGAQEALKCVSGNYTPIHQFYYYECFEALPAVDRQKAIDVRKAFRAVDRYEGQRILFGDHFQDLISQSSVFLVGAGALGCELLKQFALMGASTAPGSLLDITDLDTIENSNLSRQFLFREKDIGQMKAEVAASRVKIMNPELNIKANCLRVGEETENVLTSNFWESKTVIVNALDNVPTRIYVDSKCCLYQKPLLESGTLGQKANMQVVVPWLTETYGSRSDPETGEDPACTIHNFPSTIVHCIVYATSEFKGVFEQGGADLAKLQKDGIDAFVADLLKNRDTIESRLLQLQTLCMKLPPCVNLVDRACNWACALFEKYFVLTIGKILQDFPVDAKDKDGNNFWSGEKRPPRVLTYDDRDSIHRDFVRVAARLYTAVMGTELEISGDTVDSIAMAYFVTSANAATRVQVLTNDMASKQISNCLNNVYDATSVAKVLRNDALFDQLFLNQLFSSQFSTQIVAPAPIIFEKDDVTNGHVQYIAALANLRAENYDIQTVHYNEVRRLAGNIIPAMVTTTACIVGLVGIEFYKVLLWNSADPSARHPLEDYRSAFLNFALPSLQLSEPGPCTFVECSTTKEKITAWDRIDLPKNLTVRAVIDYFRERYKGEVDSIIHNSRMVYSSFGPGADSIDKCLADLVGNLPGRIFFLVGCSDPNTYDEIEVPKLCLIDV